MNMKMEYLINKMSLNEKILINLNAYIDLQNWELGIDYINELEIEKDLKDKLIKVFLLYKDYC